MNCAAVLELCVTAKMIIVALLLDPYLVIIIKFSFIWRRSIPSDTNAEGIYKCKLMTKNHLIATTKDMRVRIWHQYTFLVCRPTLYVSNVQVRCPVSYAVGSMGWRGLRPYIELYRRNSYCL